MDSLQQQESARKALQDWSNDVQRLISAAQHTILGQDLVIRQLVTALVCGGHVLIEGTPGLGKTQMVRTLAQALDVHFSRIQGTTDLMPMDITGTEILQETKDGRAWVFRAGPVFANMVLFDEINRATPKTQSALLEAMQEGAVTLGNTTHSLPQPFLVWATQNPLDLEGTYPLPEAQLDRFLFHVRISFPEKTALRNIVTQSVATNPPTKPVLSGTRLLELQHWVDQVPVSDPVIDQLLALLYALQPNGSQGRWIRQGPSPRGGMALLRAAKATALLRGRYAVSVDDITEVMLPALRHRLVLNLEGQAEGIEKEQLIVTAWLDIRSS